MSIKISFRGITCEVETVREAAELMTYMDQMQGRALKRVASLMQPVTPGQVMTAATAPDQPINGYDARGAMVEMLRLLVEAGENGADARALMGPLKTEKIKGVGGRLAVVNKVLRQIDVEVEDAYVRRKAKYGWAWYATDKTPEVIGLLEQARGGA